MLLLFLLPAELELPLLLRLVPGAPRRLSLLAALLPLELEGLQAKLLELVNALFALLTILGVVADPTTAGVGDSRLALSYEEPKKN